MTSSILISKSATPPVPNAGDVRIFPRLSDGILCSEDENGLITVYANATTASKAGIIESGIFSGTPKMASVVFDTPFPDTNYSVVISGKDTRNWIIEGLLLTTGFTINSNANANLTGQVFWNATYSRS
jgi:hypothetical protein